MALSKKRKVDLSSDSDIKVNFGIEDKSDDRDRDGSDTTTAEKYDPKSNHRSTSDNEEWKRIKGYSRYALSNLGNIYSFKGKKILTRKAKSKGIDLIDDNGKRRNHRIYQLVNMVFGSSLGNIERVRHKNSRNESTKSVWDRSVQDNENKSVKSNQDESKGDKGESKMKKTCKNVGMFSDGKVEKIFKSLQDATKYIEDEKQEKCTEDQISYACHNDRLLFGYGWKFWTPIYGDPTSDERNWKNVETDIDDIDLWVSDDGFVCINSIVNRIRNVRANNRVEDLDLDTPYDQCMHAYQASFFPSNAKRPVIQCDTSGNQIGEFESIAEAQRTLGLTNIYDAVKGKCKTAGGFIWRYKPLSVRNFNRNHKSNINYLRENADKLIN